MERNEKWHKRWHPLREAWVVYAGHRNSRPWTVSRQEVAKPEIPTYDPTCYLCPGNARVGGHRNPDYADVYIFDNDHPVMGPQAPVFEPVVQGPYRRESARGLARVICYSPRHDLTMAEMAPDAIVRIFAAWREQTREMEKTPGIRNLLIFENKGEMVGVSNPHPHGQLYAGDFTFTLNHQYMAAAGRYRTKTGRDLFHDVLGEEQNGPRVLAENEQAIAFVPFFARYAYEVLVFPKRRHLTMATLSDSELADLASVYHQVIRRMDGLFGISFPYVMSINQAPFELADPGLYHLHWQLLPPLRQPDLKKFPAGPEIGGDTFMADTIPEEKAEELRRVGIPS